MALASKNPSKVRNTIPVAEVVKEEKVRVNIEVSESVRDAWKLAALQRKTPLVQLIVDAMEAHLAK